jgi:hypothetical protein
MNSRLEHAFQDLEEAADARVRHAAMARRLSYVTTTLDIAVGPNPELNLFDMAAFLEISRNALATHWIPNVFGAGGDPVVAVFDVSIAEMSRILDTVVSIQEKRDLSSFVSHWIDKHPDHFAAENFRFSTFSESVRSEASDPDTPRITRLVQNADRALATADTMRLLAERIFHYAQKAPFLTRLQARVALDELLKDSLAPEAPSQALARAQRSGLKLVAASLLYFALRSALTRKQKARALHAPTAQ